MIMAPLSSALIKLAIRANILCMLGLIPSAIAVFVFGMAEWTFLGVEVIKLLMVFTYAALIVNFLQDALFKPIFFDRCAVICEQGIREVAKEQSLPVDALSFVFKVVRTCGKHNVYAYVGTAILAVVAFIVLGVNFGSPVSEFVALAILLFGPTLARYVTKGQLAKLRSIGPEGFETGIHYYKLTTDIGYGV